MTSGSWRENGGAKAQASYVFSQALLLAIALPPLYAASTVADESPERVIRFPTGRSVGTVYVREAKEGRAKSFYSTLYSDEWRAIGQARDEVHVPAGAEVRLDMRHAASEDLSFLDTLQPDDIQALNLNRTAVRDEGLKHVAHLAGLVILDLGATRITDDGVRHLAPLKHLRELYDGRLGDGSASSPRAA